MKLMWNAFLLLALVVPSFAGTSQPDRIVGAISNTPSVMLTNSMHPYAQQKYDQGAVEPSMKLSHVSMVLRSTPAQKADLKQLLSDLQNPSSPQYHKWLTPEEYGNRFGVSQHDLQKISKWLTAQGFEVVEEARGRGYISFSGTASQIAKVFQTEIHYYKIDGEMHFANSGSPAVPQALSNLVLGFRGLNNFNPTPMVVKPDAGNVRGFYTAPSGNFMAPADAATIYDIAALHSAGITGTGQKIVVVGQTDIEMTDIANFRAGFSLSNNPPTNLLVPGAVDPGITGDEAEADLDLEWTGAIAPDAAITFVIGDPVHGNGVFDSATYAIDNDLAPVISMSYGGCEILNVTFIPFIEPTFQQASAEGITFLASTGDSGAAGCDPDNEASATSGLAVNYPASSPEVTAVGGTEFAGDVGAQGTYWNASNGTGLGSAIQYIPETGWNDSDQAGIFQGPTIAATGGGKSSCGVESNGICSKGFPKPSWQTGVGVPADNVRDIPDISIAASANHDGYIFCSAGSCPTGNAAGIADAVQSNSIVGGTSVSAPIFAGIVSLLNQYLSASNGLGNINPKLYQLAPVSTDAFHDVATGNNLVPCTQGTTGCPGSAPFQYGYFAGVGFDLVTGLGTVDANHLALAFAGVSVTMTTTPPISSPPNVSVLLTGTVNHDGGTQPTGTITFFDGSTALGSGMVDPSSGVATFPNAFSIGGIQSLTAQYSGDGNYPQTTSPAIPLLITLGDADTTSLALSASSVDVGTSVTFTATVAGAGPPPTGTIAFMNGASLLGNGTLSSGIATFSSSTLASATYNVTANYSGDANYEITTSAPSVLNVMDFTISNGTISVAPGATGTANITLTPLGGFNGTVTYTCTGFPSEATCTVAATSSGATVTVTTAAPSTNLVRPGSIRGTNGSGMFYAMLLPGMLGLLIAGRRKRALKSGAHIMALLVILSLSTLWMGACGGSSSSGSTTPTNPGTPAGNSTLTITATSGTLVHAAAVSLTVQ